MGLKLSASNEGGEFELLPAGVYIARCFKIIDIGTQVTEWMGEEKLKPKIMVSWEILDDTVKMRDGQPYAVTKTYTASLNEKSALYADLVAWRGKPFTDSELMSFDIANLLGAYCTVQIIHNQVGDRTYANINTIMGTKERPTPVNPNVVFDISNPDMAVFEKLGEWTQDKIKAAQEWQTSQADPTPKPIKVDNIEGDEISIEDVPF